MTTVTAEQAGAYVQVSRKLRISGGPGVPARTSERPTNPKTGRYTDDPDTAPTLVTLQEGDLVDVEALLAVGGIRRQPEAPKKSGKGTG